MRDGSGFEELAGYSRAVRIGKHVAVSGTAALADGVVLHPGDTYGQTREALARALAAAEQVGASAGDVIRTRLLLADGCDWQPRCARTEKCSRRSRRRIRPFVADFIPEGVLIEVELDAVVDS